MDREKNYGVVSSVHLFDLNIKKNQQ